MRFYNAKKSRAFFIPALAACSMVANAGVKNVVLEDFEGTQSATPFSLQHSILMQVRTPRLQLQRNRNPVLIA